MELFDERGDFQSKAVFDWMRENYYLPISASVLYLILVFLGKKWMEDRERYSLKTGLIIWNAMLAVFSLLGAWNFYPSFIRVIRAVGFEESVCKLSPNPWEGMWFALFAFSKIVEFGDTAFVVLRKSQLQFLHWYHHITVLLYSWFALTAGMFSAGYWFATVNFTVHVIMYTYYTLRAIGIYVPQVVAQLITIMQIAQMILGLYVNYVLYKFHSQGRSDCFFDLTFFFLTCCLYGSYAILFIEFFYRKYVSKGKVKKN